MSNLIPFSISEFCITGEDVPLSVADKILEFHITPILPFRLREKVPVWASQKAGYRPPFYEKSKGRSGKSQHCFLKSSKGAVDWTTKPTHLLKLLEFLKDETSYTRICYYPNNGFVHCDYKHPERGRRYFECDSPTSQWQFKEDL